jgi:hypothetical protein
MVPPHNPLRKTLGYGAAVIGFAALGGVIVYFFTAGLLYLRSNLCDASGSSAWCRDANIAKLPTDVLRGRPITPTEGR